MFNANLCKWKCMSVSHKQKRVKFYFTLIPKEKLGKQRSVAIKINLYLFVEKSLNHLQQHWLENRIFVDYRAYIHQNPCSVVADIFFLDSIFFSSTSNVFHFYYYRMKKFLKLFFFLHLIYDQIGFLLFEPIECEPMVTIKMTITPPRVYNFQKNQKKFLPFTFASN